MLQDLLRRLSRDLAAANRATKAHAASALESKCSNTSESIVASRQRHNHSRETLKGARPVTSERALLFTDVVDSTRLTERLGDVQAAELWAAHDRKTRALLAHHNVREVNRTDGFFLVFDRVVDAASFALAYQVVLAELGMEARAGLHLGSVTLRENAPADVARGAKRVEVEGLATPLTARVMNLAQGRQTLLTATARAALGESIPPNAEIARHGYYRLKGIEEPVEIYE